MDGRPVLFNGVSGKLLPLAPGDRDRVAHFATTGDLGDLSEARARELVEARALIADGTDELSILHARYRMSQHDDRRLGLTLVTSLGCNFDCPYCFEEKHPAIMDDEIQQAVLRLVDDSMHRIKSISVTWMGGEPLVGKRSLLTLSDRLIERCDARGVAYDADIITNGWHLTADTCRELEDRRVSYAQVTIDGPPDVHDRMRPLVGGGSTFWRIVDNLHHAVASFDVQVRINVDRDNLGTVEDLLRILQAEGLSGKLVVGGTRLQKPLGNPNAPSCSYGADGYGPAEWALVDLEVDALIAAYGFGGSGLPSPCGAPCTAVSATSIVVGADGEIWKCWEEIGDRATVIGDIRDYVRLDDSRVRRWLSFDPTVDPQCRTCIALPTCMGGCLQKSMIGEHRDAQCGTFRFNHLERIKRSAALRLGTSIDQLVDLTALPFVEASRSRGCGSSSGGGCGSSCGSGSTDRPAARPVSIGRKPMLATH